VLENSDHLSLCSNAEFPGEPVTEDGPSELYVRERERVSQYQPTGGG